MLRLHWCKVSGFMASRLGSPGDQQRSAAASAQRSAASACDPRGAQAVAGDVQGPGARSAGLRCSSRPILPKGHRAKSEASSDRNRQERTVNAMRSFATWDGQALSITGRWVYQVALASAAQSSRTGLGHKGQTYIKTATNHIRARTKSNKKYNSFSAKLHAELSDGLGYAEIFVAGKFS